MTYVNRHASVRGQHQLYQHHHAQNGGYPITYPSSINPATSAWRVRHCQKAHTQYQQQNQYHHEQHEPYGSMVTFNREYNNSPDDHQHHAVDEEERGGGGSVDAAKVIWNAPITMAHTLLRAFSITSCSSPRTFPHNTGGGTPPFIPGSAAEDQATKILENQFERCEDPGLFMIQTLFKIGEHCAAQRHEGKKSNVEGEELAEERASRALIDMFQSYMNRRDSSDFVPCEDVSESKNEGGIDTHNSNRDRSKSSSTSKSYRNGIDEVCDHVMKYNKDNIDLISWESDDGEEKEHLNIDHNIAKAPKTNGQHSQQQQQQQQRNQGLRPRPLTQVHLQMLLDAIVMGKYAFQVFLAIDAFGLNEVLSTCIEMQGLEAEKKKNACCIGIGDDAIEHDEYRSHQKGKEKEYPSHYGVLLTNSLTQRGYLLAAIHVTCRMRQSHNRHHSNNIQDKVQNENSEGVNMAHQMLVECLIDRGHAHLIYLLVGADRELCRAVIQTIDHRFAKQIWTWIEGEVVVPALLDPFLVVQCRTQASSLMVPSRPLSVLIGMLEIASYLGFSFGLENTMKSFRSIQFIQEYCTVLTFLSNSRNHLSPWIFIPAVLTILKNNVALQRLIVWTFARRKEGVATADLLASALGLRVFLTKCLDHRGWEEDDEYGVQQRSLQPQRDEGRRSDLPRRGVKEKPHLLEQPLSGGHDQMFEQGDSPQEGWLSSPSSSLSSSSSKGNERYIPHQDEEEGHIVVNEKNINYSSLDNRNNKNEVLKVVTPLLNGSIAQMSVSSINHHHQNNNNPNFNSILKHNHGPLPLQAFNPQNSTQHLPMPEPFQAKTTSASTSASIPTPLPREKSSFYPDVHQHMKHSFSKSRPTTTRNNTNTMTNFNKREHYLPVYMRNYKPSPETTIILLNNMSQLQQLYNSLFHSDNVGISLIQPLAKPWARLAVTLPLQKKQKQEQEANLEMKQRQRHKDRDGVGEGGKGEGGGAFLQLACDSDKSVYVIDLEVFLDIKVDPEHKLPRLLGEIFFNPSICKLAYNWKEESMVLKYMFPTLREPQCHMDNLLDFYYIWIVRDSSSSSSTTTTSATTTLSHPASRQPHLEPNQHHYNGPAIGTGTGTGTGTGADIDTDTGVYKIKAWCTEKPFLPTTMIQPRFKSISGLLYHVLGRFLRRTSRLGWDAWKVRPLPECLQTDLAMSAQCLVDMYAVLDKDGTQRDRDGTAEFKIQPNKAI